MESKYNIYIGTEINKWLIKSVTNKKEGSKSAGPYFVVECLVCHNTFIVRVNSILVRNQECCNTCRLKLEKEKMIGLENENNKGYKMKIIGYRNDEDVDIEFFNGEKVLGTSFKYFREGLVRLPSEKSMKSTRIKEKNVNKDGLKMEISYYNNHNDIGVRFIDDNVEVTKQSYSRFEDGTITHPTIKREDSRTIKDKEIRKGYKFTTSRGVKAEVTEYFNSQNCTVTLENGIVIENMTFRSVKNKQLPNEYIIKQLIGKWFYASCGLKMKIVEERGSRDLDIEFEDGSKVFNKSISALYSGKIAHPTIKRGKGGFAGSLLSFDVKFAFSLKEKGKVFYYCKCSKCGLHDILTPSKMLKHKCEGDLSNE